MRVYDPRRDDDILWVSPNGLWAVIFDRVTDRGHVNVLVTNEGAYSSSYTMYPDGTVLRDHDNLPKYVDDAACRMLEAMAERYSDTIRRVAP